MKRTPNWAFIVVIACVACIFAALLIWGRAPNTDPPGAEAPTKSAPAFLDIERS